MALVSVGAAQLKAKLQTKARWRPHAAMRKKLPNGSELLSDLPTRADAPEGDEKAEKEYCAAMQRVSRVFGKQRRSNSTADEHKQYMRIFDGWLVRKGFGSFVEAEIEHGRCVALHPRRKADGTVKVMKGDLLIS